MRNIKALSLKATWDLTDLKPCRKRSRALNGLRQALAAMGGLEHIDSSLHDKKGRLHFCCECEQIHKESLEQLLQHFLVFRARLIADVDHLDHAPENNTFVYGVKKSLRFAQLELLAELLAPSLLLMLGNAGKKPIVLSSGSLKIELEHRLADDTLQKTLPLLSGMVTKALDNIQNEKDIRHLMLHPGLIQKDEENKRIVIPQKKENGDFVLSRGRMTTLKGETHDGENIRIYAQQSLTIMYMESELEVRRLSEPDEADRLRSVVLGEDSLPIDHFPGIPGLDLSMPMEPGISIVPEEYYPTYLPEGDEIYPEPEPEPEPEAEMEIAEFDGAEICEARLEGPAVLCLADGLKEYKVIPTCQGRCTDWKIDDGDIAEITSVNDCIAEVNPLKAGHFLISGTFTSRNGQVLVLQKKVEVYGVLHVRGNTVNNRVTTVPLVHPHPFITITSPETTAQGRCLQQGGNYLIHTRRLQQGIDRYRQPPSKAQSIGLQDVGRNYLEIQIKLSGTISDYFQQIDSVAWQVDTQGALHSGSLDRGDHFSESSFDTKIPGEDDADNNTVVIRGLGVHYIKIMAANPLGRWGSDWIKCRVLPNKTDSEEMAQRQRHLASLMQQTSGDPAAHAVRIQQARLAVENSYFASLQNPCVEVEHNHQVPQTFTLGPNCMTRTQGRDKEAEAGPQPATVTAESLLGPDTRNLGLVEEAPGLYLNQQPVKEYWVTESEYTFTGTKYSWPADGVLLGDMGHHLISQFKECQRANPVFGVTLQVPDCRVVKKTQHVEIKAQGQPESDQQNQKGKYRYSVVAKPGSAAAASIAPSGWTNSKTANLAVDTEGYYTIKVEYQLGGRTCPLTYALADTKIILEKEQIITWQVARSGTYAGAMAKHLNRPLYQEKQAGETRAAEMLIEPHASRGPDMGKSFKAAFFIPREIEFVDNLIVRTYFKPYSAALTRDDYRDFVGAPNIVIDPRAPFQALVDIETDEEIMAIHLLNINYRKLNRLKGQAVAIFMQQFLKDDDCYIYDEYFEEPPDLTPTVSIAIPPPGSIDPPQPLVNLLLYHRDLGNAPESNGFQKLSNAKDYHNLTNGNLHQSIPIIQTHGHGENTDLVISYNSLLASYQDSLEYFQSLNGVSDEDLANGYCPNIIGKGWTHSYNIFVRDYIRNRDINGRVKDFYIELACPDGNRIQFKMTENAAAANDKGLGQYSIVNKSDCWLGSAQLGSGLRMEKAQNAQGKVIYQLQDMYGKIWHFDEDGHLTAVKSLLIQNSNTPALEVSRDTRQTKIKDSSGRETTISHLRSGSALDMLTIKTPDDERTYISTSNQRVETISIASAQTWQFEYLADLGYTASNRRSSFLKQMTDPRGIASHYEYYEGTEFEGLSRALTREFWGRLGKACKGENQKERTHLWRYKDYRRNRQELVYRNPGMVEFVYSYDVRIQAVNRIAYIKQIEDPVSHELTQVPNYGQVLQNVTRALPERSAQEFTYFSETKLLETAKDIHGNERRMEYIPVLGRQSYLLEKIHGPDQSIREYSYYPDTRRIKKIFSPIGSNTSASAATFTEYRYDPQGNTTKILHPALNTPTGLVVHEEVFQHNAATGLLESYTDKSGVTWTYRYLEDNRDPARLKLPTSRSVTVGPETLTWEMSYNKKGQVVKNYEPVFGEEKRIEYHKLGPVRVEHLQAIPTESGRVEGASKTYFYDELLNMTSAFYPNATEMWTYNDFGELKEEIDRAGNKTTYQYDKNSNIIILTDAGNHRTHYVYDELNRERRINPPLPDTRPAAKRSVAYCELIDIDDRQKTRHIKRHAVTSQSGPLGELIQETFETYLQGRLKTSRVNLKGASPLTTAYDYTTSGQVFQVTLREGSSVKRHQTHIYDTWGRQIELHEFQDGQSRIHQKEYDAADRTVKQYSPVFSGGRRISSEFDYDRIGRLLRVKDSFGHIQKEYEHFNFGNNAASLSGRKAYFREMGQNPSADADAGGAIFLRRQYFNRRGLATVNRFEDSHTSAKMSENFYDRGGRVVSSRDRSGVLREIERDGLNRITDITIKRRKKRPHITWAQYDANNPGHSTIDTDRLRYRYAWNGEVKESGELGHTKRTEFDNLGRPMKQFTGRGLEEELVYDGSDRLTQRMLPGNISQRFDYNDAQRKILATYRHPDTRAATLSSYDWENKLVEFENRENLVMQRGPYNKVKLNYEYKGFSKLHKKIYRSAGSNRVLATLEYEYNRADLRTKTKLLVKRPRQPDFIKEIDYDYDDNGRMTEMGSPGSLKYYFKYNHAGFLKKLGRPYTTASMNNMANSSTYTHDRQGRLTSIVERKGFDSADDKLSRMDLSYDRRQKESWEPDGQFAIEDLDHLPAGSSALRGISYRRHFREDAGAGIIRDQYTQDIAYTDSGKPYASITRFYDVPTIHVDSRVSEMSRSYSRRTSTRNFRDYDIPGNYKDFELDQIVTTDYRNSRTKAVSRKWSVRRPAAPKMEPRQRYEGNQFGAEEKMREQYRVIEDLSAGDRNTPTTQDRQVHKLFTHDVLGNLVYTRDREEIRAQNDDFRPDERDDPSRESMDNTTRHQYGPDGEELFNSVGYYRKVSGAAIPRTAHRLLINDGREVVAELDYETGNLRHYDVIPGLGKRLSAATVFGQWATAINEYYRFDHRGTSLYLTDYTGKVSLEYGYTSPEGETDLFGFKFGPRGPDTSPIPHESIEERWAYYQSAGPRIDIGMGESASLEKQIEQILVKNLHPAEPIPAMNNYAASANRPYTHLHLPQSLSTFDYVVAGIQVIGGALEILGGAALMIGSAGTLAVFGGLVVLNGLDNLIAGTRTLSSGKQASTVLESAIKEVTIAAGGSEGLAMGIYIGSQLILGLATAAAQIRQAGKIARLGVASTKGVIAGADDLSANAARQLLVSEGVLQSVGVNKAILSTGAKFSYRITFYPKKYFESYKAVQGVVDAAGIIPHTFAANRLTGRGTFFLVRDSKGINIRLSKELLKDSVELVRVAKHETSELYYILTNLHGKAGMHADDVTYALSRSHNLAEIAEKMPIDEFWKTVRAYSDIS